MKGNTRFVAGGGDTTKFIVFRYEQSKNRNLNTRFTSGKDTRIASKIKTCFQFGLVQGHYVISSGLSIKR